MLAALFEALLSLLSKRVALRSAIRRNDIRDVEALLRRGALQRPCLLRWERPLALASRLGRVNIVRVLVNAGVSPVEQRGSAIGIAADVGNAAVIEALLEGIVRAPDRSVQPEKHEKEALGRGLLAAARAGNTEICHTLLERGASVDVRDGGPKGYTSLMYAAWCGHDRVAELLISRGADVNATAVNGWSAMMAAASKCHVGVLSALLKAGADPGLRNKRGVTALEMAQFSGCNDAIHALTSRPSGKVNLV